MTKPIVLCIALFLTASGAFAQLKKPNNSGISAALVGFSHTLQGMDSFNRFWIALGGIPKPFGGLPENRKIFMFPGLFVMGDVRGSASPPNPSGQLRPITPNSPRPPQSTPSPSIQGSEGSRIDYIGFKVRDLPTVIRTIQRAGFSATSEPSNGTIFFLNPNGAKVKLKEDKSLAVAIEADEVLIKVPDVDRAAKWYQEWCGAAIIRDGNSAVAQVPGLNIRFVESKENLAPTNGRAIDRLGFEVTDLRTFSERIIPSRITVRGKTMTISPTFAPLKGLAKVVDPWGVTIEFVQGIRDIK